MNVIERVKFNFWRGALAILVAAAITAGVLVPVTPARAETGTQAGSLAASLSALGGLLDDRTGLVGFDLPVASVPGPSGSGSAVSARFSQLLASSKVDRFGLGDGWSWGMAFVDIERGRVVLPAGEYQMDDSQASGLADYRLDDVHFRAASGLIPGTSVAYSFVMESRADGSAQFFGDSGDLLGAEDCFGHTTLLSWQVVNGTHRLTQMIGPWGSALNVAWSGSKVTVSAPRRVGHAQHPTTVISLSKGRLSSITDPAGQSTRIEWSDPRTEAGLTVPAAVISPTGARTEFAYREYEPRSGSVLAVSSVRVRDADGSDLVDPIEVSLDPDGANGGRNWTGCPQYCPDGSGADRVANSGDAAFTYRVRLSQANGQQIERTYNAVHVLKLEVARVAIGSDPVEVSRTELGYPGETSTGGPPKAAAAPANYQTPNIAAVTITDPAEPSHVRRSTVHSDHDSMGRVVRKTLGAVQTVTEYGPNSIPTRTETRDTLTGIGQILTNTLTSNQKAIASTVVDAVRDGSDPTLISETNFEYQSGRLAGEIARTTNTGDRSAPGGDPGVAVSTTRTSIQEETPGVGTRTDILTGPDGVAHITVSDLANGTIVSTSTPGHGITRSEYDLADRLVRQVAADGTATTTGYTVASDTVTVTERREADGYSMRTISDALGRLTKTETNYQPSSGKLEGWRTLSRISYNTSGQQTELVDAAGRTTLTSYDAWGRVGAVERPDGSKTVHSYDEVAATTTTGYLGTGAPKPGAIISETRDERGNLVQSETRFTDGTDGQQRSTAFDGFDRPLTTEESLRYAIESRYSTDGRPATEAFTPKPSVDSATATHYRDAFGNETLKTLTRGSTSVSGWTRVFDTAGRMLTSTAPGSDDESIRVSYRPDSGMIESLTGPDGTITHQRHDAAGRLIETWASPAGDPTIRLKRTLLSYDPVTGQLDSTWFADDEAGTKISFEYYPDGSVKMRTDPGEKTTSYSYTDDGAIRAVTDITGTTTHYTYDSASARLTKATQSRNGEPLTTASYRYDPLGRLTQVERLSNVGTKAGVSTYRHNDAGHVVGEEHTDGGGHFITAHDYTRTADGRLLTDVAQTADLDSKGISETATEHRYDTDGRLTATTIREGETPGQGALIRSDDYLYDLAGNLTRHITTTPTEDASTAATVTEFRHDAAARTTAITVDGHEGTQAYDMAGRLTRAADGTRYAYDITGHLLTTTASDGLSVANTYNPLGERTTQTTTHASGETDSVVYHPGVETGRDGTAAVHFVGSTLEARTIVRPDASSETSWYLTDQHGDKTQTLSPAGAATSRIAYTDWGVATTYGDTARSGSIIANPYGYAGQYTTPTGAQLLGTRSYEPSLAAFTTPDDPSAGMLNPYTYAIGDPVNYVDPTGRAPEWTSWLSFGMSAAAIAVGVVGIIATPVGVPIAATTWAFLAIDVASAAASALAYAESRGYTDVLDPRGEAFLQIGQLALALPSTGNAIRKWGNALRPKAYSLLTRVSTDTVGTKPPLVSKSAEATPFPEAQVSQGNRPGARTAQAVRQKSVHELRIEKVSTVLELPRTVNRFARIGINGITVDNLHPSPAPSPPPPASTSPDVPSTYDPGVRDAAEPAIISDDATPERLSVDLRTALLNLM